MEPVVESIVISRPIEEVFDVATCQERCVVWRGPIFATQKTSDDSKKISSYSGARHFALRGSIYRKLLKVPGTSWTLELQK